MQTARSNGRGSAVEAVDPDLAREVMKHLNDTFDFVPSDELWGSNAEKKLFDYPLPPMPDVSWYQPMMDTGAFRNGVPTRITNGEKKRSLLTPKQERNAFCRYNFCKKKLCELQASIRKLGLSAERANNFCRWHRLLLYYREYITKMNLGLVLAMAGRVRKAPVDFSDLVSEGNMALLRALEKFDVDLGFKFSTYAWRSILKAFSGLFSKAYRRLARQVSMTDYGTHEYKGGNWKDDRNERDENLDMEDPIECLRFVLQENKARLTFWEAVVIKGRFDIGGQALNPATLQEVGEAIRYSKEKVRQIRLKALEKIRRELERRMPGVAERFLPDDSAFGDEA